MWRRSLHATAKPPHGNTPATPFLPHMQRVRLAGFIILSFCQDHSNPPQPSNHPPLCICGSKCHQMAITCIRSNYIDCVQGHRLLPPPHPWHQTSPLFALLTSCRNWSGCNVRPNCLTTDLDTCGGRFHAAFFQNVPCAQIFPNPSCPLPWSMHPHHLVRSAYVEPP